MITIDFLCMKLLLALLDNNSSTVAQCVLHQLSQQLLSVAVLTRTMVSEGPVLTELWCAQCHHMLFVAFTVPLGHCRSGIWYFGVICAILLLQYIPCA